MRELERPEKFIFPSFFPCQLPETTCQALKRCPGEQSPMINPVTVGVKDDLQCEFCEAMIHKVIVQFNNSATKSQVREVMEHLCDMAGSFRQEVGIPSIVVVRRFDGPAEFTASRRPRNRPVKS